MYEIHWIAEAPQGHTGLFGAVYHENGALKVYLPLLSLSPIPPFHHLDDCIAAETGCKYVNTDVFTPSLNSGLRSVELSSRLHGTGPESTSHHYL